MSLSGPGRRLWVRVGGSPAPLPAPRPGNSPPRLDLPGKAPERRQKVLQMQGKPPPATSPTSIGNGGTSLHTMTGVREEVGKGGTPRGKKEEKKKEREKRKNLCDFLDTLLSPNPRI